MKNIILILLFLFGNKVYSQLQLNMSFDQVKTELKKDSYSDVVLKDTLNEKYFLYQDKNNIATVTSSCVFKNNVCIALNSVYLIDSLNRVINFLNENTVRESTYLWIDYSRGIRFTIERSEDMFTLTKTKEVK